MASKQPTDWIETGFAEWMLFLGWLVLLLLSFVGCQSAPQRMPVESRAVRSLPLPRMWEPRIPADGFWYSTRDPTPVSGPGVPDHRDLDGDGDCDLRDIAILYSLASRTIAMRGHNLCKREPERCRYWTPGG